MKLTPLDIRHKDFKRGMRGYADVEVDEFLDEVADEYERLFKENIDLNERLESVQEKVTQYKRIEETLQKTLVSAQASAEELKQNATKEAQLILRDAELKARQMVNDTYTEKQTIEQTMAKLRAAEQDFAFKFRQLLEGYLKQLDEAAETTAEPDEQGVEFDRQAQAIKEAIAREAAVAVAAPEPARAPDPEATMQEPPPAPEPEAVAEAPAPEPEAAVTAAQPAPAPELERAPAQTEAQADAFKPVFPPAATDEPVTAASRSDGEETEKTVKERVTFGDDDDLLADVDGGVNENEFQVVSPAR